MGQNMRRITLEQAQQSLLKFSKEIYGIPEEFAIHGQYLGLIAKERFALAFKTLRDIMADMIYDAALYEDYIEKSPAFIKEAFINDAGKCRHCKDPCGHRRIYSIDKKQYEKCDGEVFFFDDISSDTISYYTSLINLSASKGRSAGYKKGLNT